MQRDQEKGTTHCPLGARGYARDGKTGQVQLEYELLSDAYGRPEAIRVFESNATVTRPSVRPAGRGSVVERDGVPGISVGKEDRFHGAGRCGVPDLLVRLDQCTHRAGVL